MRMGGDIFIELGLGKVLMVLTHTEKAVASQCRKRAGVKNGMKKIREK